MSFFIIIRGPLGSGKSTIASALQLKLKNAEIFSIDKILDENDLAKDKEDGYISQKSFIKVNEIVSLKAKELLSQNIPVIFDGNFYWKSQIDDLISRLDCKYFIFTLKASLETCIERDSKRNNPCGEDATMVVYNKTMQIDCGVEIDTTESVDECVEKIMLRMKNEVCPAIF